MKKLNFIKPVLGFVFIITSYQAQGQNSVEFSNTSGCNWEVVFYNGTTALNLPFALNAYSSGASCGITFSGTVTSMAISDPLTGCAANFGSTGGTQTGIPTWCGWTCSVLNTTQTIQAVVNAITCSGTPTNEYTISITP